MRFRLPASARHFLVILLSLAICVGLAWILLAWLVSGQGASFGASFEAIGKCVWQRAILPGINRRHPFHTGGFFHRLMAAFGDQTLNYNNWIDTLHYATPILLTGLSAAVAFRASVWNIGGQGQYLVGAIAAVAIGTHWATRPSLLQPAILLAAMGAGAIWGAAAALLERWRQVPVVLSTLLLNFVALELMRSLLQGTLNEAGSTDHSPQVLDAARLPMFHIPGATKTVEAGIFIALAAAIAVAIVLRWTTFGFRLRVVGENPQAARFAGMRVGMIASGTLALSGALAGLAGGVQVAGVIPYQLLLSTGDSAFGFTGIAVALLGRLSALGVVLAALFFGFLDTAFSRLEGDMRINFVAAQAMQGAILIVMLMVMQPAWRRHLARFARGLRAPFLAGRSQSSATLTRPE